MNLKLVKNFIGFCLIAVLSFGIYYFTEIFQFSVLYAENYYSSNFQTLAENNESTTLSTTFTVTVASVTETRISATGSTKNSLYLGDDPTSVFTNRIFIITFSDQTSQTYYYNEGDWDTTYIDYTYDFSSVGEKTVTVTLIGYEKYPATFTITVKAVELVDVTLNWTGSHKTSYFVGDEIDLTNCVLTAKYNNGSTNVLYYNDYEVSFMNACDVEYDFSTSGEKTVTIIWKSYSDYPVIYTVTVNSIVPVSIEVTKTPSKILYHEGEELDVTGGQVTVTFNDGHTEVLDMTDDCFSYEYDFSTGGTKTVTVLYEFYNPDTQSYQLTSVSYVLNGNDDSDNDNDLIIDITDKIKKIDKKILYVIGGVGLLLILYLIFSVISKAKNRGKR